MSVACRQAAGLVALMLSALLLQSCAHRPLPPPVAQTSPLTGRLTSGTVVSVRQISPAAGAAEITAVLAALGQAANPRPPPAVELVIRRQDNSVTSIVQPQGAGQPNFIPGERIAIVEAAATIVRPQ